ncbi:hypothetical protein GPECTOR_9g466 [Gonium pectorale]|uniref:Uncharacterized protein n=1 Tax=Gonium pectorale TaxID=33097 RepID=A0A150GRN7_GONPE|nr:hypothetical protein GPECTOR_9g466 [Gonium pectorale]|eukprot:KXZ52422.1 hypothetical protein GPECTOR_9g466 [Gonium pectorale]
MVARPRELLRELRDGPENAKVKALKAIKNQIIGSKAKKAIFVSEGAVAEVLEVLNAGAQSHAVQKQAAVVLGSLTFGTEAGLREVISKGGLQSLTAMLHSEDGAVVEAGLRAVKMVVQQSAALPYSRLGAPASSPAAVATLRLDSASISAVAGPWASSGWPGTVAAMAAAVLACCCRREQERDLAIAAGAPAGLLRLLQTCSRPDAQAAALECLASMLPHHPPTCAAALADLRVTSRLLALLREPDAATRLCAASCVATLSRLADGVAAEAQQRAALPVLLRLLSSPSPATRLAVPPVLADLLERGGEALTRAAADADTVRLLAGMLAAEAAPPAAGEAAAAAGGGGTGAVAGGGSSSALREGCLRALGCLCLNRDDSRTQLMEARVLRHVVRCLEDPAEGVRAGAALLLRALSRSTRHLRGGLLEGAAGGPGSGSGELAPLLVARLDDGCEAVRASAAAALTNLVLDFSAAKSALLAAGGLARLVALAAGAPPGSGLRHQAVWALANLAYRADASVRSQILQALPWARLRALLLDPRPSCGEQALALLRNLAMGERAHIAELVRWAAAAGQPGADSAASATGAAEAEASSGPVGEGARVVEGGKCDIGATSAASSGGTGAVDGSGAGSSGADLLDVLQERIEVALAAMPEGSGAACGSTPAPASGSPSSASPAAIPSPPAQQQTEATAALTAQAVHALYTIGNLLTGSAAVKDAVAARRPLLAALTLAMRPARADELALPAVWCAINLTWPPSAASAADAAAGAAAPGGGGGEGRLAREARERARERELRAEQEAVATRCRALLAVGGGEALEALAASHPCRDVQERARTALEQLRRGAGEAAVGAATAEAQAMAL